MKLSSEQKPNKALRPSIFIKQLIDNLGNTERGKKKLLSIAIDMGMAFFSLWLAYTIRHGIIFNDFHKTWYVFLVLPLITAAIFSSLGVYRWVIRSSNHLLFLQLAKGSIISSVALVMLFFLAPPDLVSPRSLFLIYGLLLLVGCMLYRFVWQSLHTKNQQGEPVAVYGAGSAGRQLVSLLNCGKEYKPVTFIDDDQSYAGSTLFGLPVLNGHDPDLKMSLTTLDVSRVILAMPSVSSLIYQKKLEQIAALEVPMQTMPNVTEIVSGKARADDVRDISINDILGRNEVKPNIGLMRQEVTGKTVLVTGGGGSIGSELCRQIVALAPQKLIVMDNCEANLYHITEELNHTNTVKKFTPLLGSVIDQRRLRKLFSSNKINSVFHAAAYKHVPIVEAQPDQGVEVNVFGTLNVLNESIKNGVSSFVLISTDKAVRPTNVMGASKRIAELIVQSKANLHKDIKISTVRFGNVLGSSGSVVPKFKKQIEAGGPLTLTHKEMTRYFMTIPEAAQLVLQASAIARGGDVFVLDMGEPVRIEMLAKSMVRLYGKKLSSETGDPNDIDIVVEGLRPGEKLYEELFFCDERKNTQVKKISTAKEAWLGWRELSIHIQLMQQLVFDQDNDALKSLVLQVANDPININVDSLAEHPEMEPA